MTLNEPVSFDHPRRWILVTGLSAGLLVLSVAGSFLFFLQPWASCPPEDSSAGCPVTGVQVYAQTVVFLLVPLSAVLLVVAGIRASRRRVAG